MHVHILGICGTFMGSLALLARELGHTVSGSDAGVYPPMSTQLEEAGIALCEDYAPANLEPRPDLVVIGNALSRGNPEVEAVLDRSLPYVSGPQWLAEQVLPGRRVIAVAGTHGKTTTASLVAWLLESAGLAPGFLIGGVPRNFGVSARLGAPDAPFVVEADEYDTAFFDKRSKFVHYLPELVIVNNLEFDHADIFADLDAVKRTFGHLIRLVPDNGLVLLNGDDANALAVFAREGHSPMKRVGFATDCEARITEVDYRRDGTAFTLEGERYETVLNGEYNVRNAAMAITAARFAGVEPEAIRRAVAAFRSVKRRQEVRGTTGRGIVVVDDFGHHPTAIREAIAGMRHRFPGARLWAIFEPRSNTTRRRVFQESLAEALGQADAVCLAAVARAELLAEEERLDPDLLMQTLRERGLPSFYEPDVEAIVARLEREAADGDVIVVFSNGGFGGIHDKLLEKL